MIARDVVIIGADAGGGKVARHLVALGKRLPRNPRNPAGAPARMHQGPGPGPRVGGSGAEAGRKWSEQ